MTSSALLCFHTCITSINRLILYFSFCGGDDEQAWETLCDRYTAAEPHGGVH